MNINSSFNLFLHFFKNKTYCVRPIQDSESISCHPNRSQSTGPLSFGSIGLVSIRLFRQCIQIIDGILHIGGSGHTENSIFCWVIAQGIHWGPGSTPQLKDRLVFLGGKIELAKVSLLDIIEQVAVDGMSWPFPLQFEDDHARIVASGE